MTERRRRLPKLSLRTALARVGVTSGVAAVVLTAGLWVQMATGRDPALGPGDPGADAADGARSAVTVLPAATEAQAVAPPAPAPLQTTTS